MNDNVMVPIVMTREQRARIDRALAQINEKNEKYTSRSALILAAVMELIGRIESGAPVVRGEGE